MLITDLATSKQFRHLSKCKCKKSGKLSGFMFSFNEKYNYETLGTTKVRLYVNISVWIELSSNDFYAHFNVI